MARIAPSLVGQNLCAFLDMIAFSEGTSTVKGSDDGYNVLVGGGLFKSYAEHPRIALKTRWGLSDAAGRYQIMAAIPGKITTDTWDWASRAVGVKDFSPEAQDRVAIYLIKRKGAVDAIREGRIRDAVALCRREWASLPGAGYGQREHDIDLLLSQYTQANGTIA